ncbi:hypothetical protein [Lishizhenia tianjinensis]|nr:hypothetical protein [Lishizhenia tianjinensis]
MTLDQKLLKEIDKDLTTELRARQDYIMEKLRVRLNQDRYSFQRFNGLFGGKNNTYVDSVRTQFTDFNDFYSQWLKGVTDHYEERYYNGKAVNNHNAVLLKDAEIEKYVRIFLERNFYRNLKERTRSKPDERLWTIWFGYNLVFGLLIAPRYIQGVWNNDKSEIRRVNYKYWTLGHVISEGFVDNNTDSTFKIRNLREFEAVYISILKQLSNSQYEKEIYDRYIQYLKDSTNYLEEPLLIPELRYNGLDKKHKYRVDFTVLNAHTMDYVGFEISPASSHMSVLKLKEKQKAVNEELSIKWGKEMDKRNDYFKDFGITIITFTDESLMDIDNCWLQIENILKRRANEKTSVRAELARIASI